jgi:hypothetical protein
MGRGRKNAQNGRSKTEQYIYVPYGFLKSKAWHSLSGGAVKIFWELRIKYNGFNNGRLSLSCQNAADTLKLSKSTVSRAFRELEDKGFIIKTTQGVFCKGLASEYHISLVDDTPVKNWRYWPDSPPVLTGLVPPKYPKT